MAYEIIPNDSLLPPASILEKIKTRDAAAPERILRRTETIGDERRTRQKATVRASGWRSFLQGLAGAFNPFASSAIFDPPLTHAPLLRNLGLNHDFAVTGNDLRQALQEYLHESGLSAQDLGLTAEEQEGLCLLVIPGYQPMTVLVPRPA